MTFPTVIGTVRVSERMGNAMLDRVRRLGPIIVVHAAGEFASTLGAHFTAVFVAKPGESTTECLKRNNVKPDANECIFNFAFDPTLE